MDHAVILQYVQALGFPVCSSIALGWALWKIGGQLLLKFFQHVDAIAPKLDRIAESNDGIKEQISKWPSDLVSKVSDSVIEKLKSEAAMRGCPLTERDIAVLVENHHGRRQPK